MRQLHAQNRRLKRVQSLAIPDLVVRIFAGAPVIAQPGDLRCQRVVIGADGSRIAIGPKIFAGIEAEARRAAPCSGALTVQLCAVRLSGILDDAQIMPRRDRRDGVHRRKLSIEMHGDDRFRPRRDCRLDTIRIDVVGCRININQHDPRADLHDRLNRGDERVRRRDHPVALADAERFQRQKDRRRPAGDAHTVPRALKRCKGVLKLPDFFPADEAGMRQDTRNSRIDLRLNALILRFQIYERDIRHTRTS